MQPEKLVVNVIGYPACGKSTACKQLEEQGFTIFRPSDVLREYAKKRDFQLTCRRDYVDLHHMLNEENPYAIVEPIIASSDSRICVDGLRSPLLLDNLQGTLANVVTVALDCPIETRFEHVEADDARRGTHRAPASLEAFQADELPDYVNPDRNLPNMQEMMARADHHVDASQSPLQVANALDIIIAAELSKIN